MNKKLAIRKIEDTYLIVTLDNVLHRVEDPTGVFILDLISRHTEGIRPDIIWNDVSGTFDVSRAPEHYRDTVMAFLDDLVKKGIINIEYDSDGGRP